VGDALRLFVAAYPPAEVAQALLAHLASLGLTGIRLTAPQQVHLTLHFIGDTHRRDLDGVIESVARSASGVQAPRLRVARLIRLPDRDPARLIAAEIEQHGAVAEIRRRLVLRLSRHARESRQDRFMPHMTLGRFRSPPGPLAINPAPPAQSEFVLTSVQLMQSVLHPDGAEHRLVQEFPLGTGG